MNEEIFKQIYSELLNLTKEVGLLRSDVRDALKLEARVVIVEGQIKELMKDSQSQFAIINFFKKYRWWWLAALLTLSTFMQYIKYISLDNQISGIHHHISKVFNEDEASL